MRLLTSWLVVVMVALALPAPALAQTPQRATRERADLIGTWIIRRDGQPWGDAFKGKLIVDFLMLNADSSFSFATKRQEGDSLVVVSTSQSRFKDPLRWEVVGDSLRFHGTSSNGPEVSLFQRKDQRLLLWGPEQSVERRVEKCANQIYERYDPARPLTLPPPSAITINPADLVGTWAGRIDLNVAQYHWGTILDTLVIRPDYTSRAVHLGPPDDVYIEGTWTLLPGDRFQAPGLTGSAAETIVLHDGKLIRCGYNHAVLTRIAP